MSQTGEFFLLLEHMKGSKIVKIVPEIIMGKERVEFLASLQLDMLDFVICDEAHRCTGLAKSTFTRVLDDKNIKAKKSISGGTKVNESDGFCAALPYFLYNNNDKELKKVIKSVANSKINETYALAKIKVIKNSCVHDTKCSRPKKNRMRFYRLLELRWFRIQNASGNLLSVYLDVVAFNIVFRIRESSLLCL